MFCGATVGRAASSQARRVSKRGLGLLLPHGVALLRGDILALPLDPIERLEVAKPFHRLADLLGVVRMRPLSLDRLVELATRMGHAADQDDVRSQTDSVVAVIAIHLQVAPIALEEPEWHRLTSGGIVVEENDWEIRGSAAPHP